MGRYRIFVRRSVSKNFDRITKKDARWIVKAIRVLSDDPRPAQSKKFSGEEKYRLRCGVYRIIYEIQDVHLVICVVRIRHRRDVYR